MSGRTFPRFSGIAFGLGLALSQLAQADPTPAYILQNAVQFDGGSNALPDSVFDSLKAYKVITIGEIHGTNETPAFAFEVVQLLEKFHKPVFLALEIPQSFQTEIDDYVNSGDESILRQSSFFNRPANQQDGRSSRAMAQLLTEARKIPGLKIFCFDPGNVPADGQTRDSRMAVNLRAALKTFSPASAVVLTGSIHAAITQGDIISPTYRPMGYELHSQPGSDLTVSDIQAIRLRNVQGSAWDCIFGSLTCGKNPMTEPNSPYSEAVPWNQYFLDEKSITPSGNSDGYTATFFSRTISASPPFTSSGTP